jgi:hypothetical protein
MLQYIAATVQAVGQRPVGVSVSVFVCMVRLMDG